MPTKLGWLVEQIYERKADAMAPIGGYTWDTQFIVNQ